MSIPKGKAFNRPVNAQYVGLNGEVISVGGTDVRVLLIDEDTNVLMCSGTTAPSSKAGYAKACIFIKTDAGAGTEGLYRNTGTTTSCSFEALDTITAGEIALATGSVLVGTAGVAAALDASTDTAILIGNGTTIAAHVLNTDVTMSNTGAVTIAAGVVTAGKLASTLDLSGKTVTAGELLTKSNTGIPGTNVTAVEYGEGRNHTTVLTISGLEYTIAGAADEAIGKLIYTFPAGVHTHEVSYMSVALQGGGTIDADTPEVGIGSVIASGAVATLGAVGATSEDYIVGTAAADCSGTATVVGPVGATAGVLTGISLNKAADVKAVHLNIADGWAGADTATASGTVVLKWTTIA